MSELNRTNAILLGVSIFAGLAVLGYQLSSAAIQIKEYERTVTAKGLSEREFEADIVIWPIRYSDASNDLAALYASVDAKTAVIRKFLEGRGVAPDEISTAVPAITDKSAQQYGGDSRAEFRFAAQQTVTVYSEQVSRVRELMSSISELGKEGIAISGGDYQAQPEYLFTRLNDVKPEMIEESTRKAREVAQKFAADSESRLGKIKRASQGQFSIQPRDQNNPHIKKVRVVSTVAYYLSD